MLITLLTDFGTQDGYAAAMKGVILSLYPETRIIDITHEIKPQNIEQAAFVIQNAAPFFPENTVHVIVVDPGVGGKRNILAVQAEKQIFLAPDNGVLKLIFKKYPDCAVYSVENTALFNKTVSATFHGRDIFAPAAAHLAAGTPIEKTGPRISTFFRGKIMELVSTDNQMDGFVTHIDRFGNAVTNIPFSGIPENAETGVICERLVLDKIIQTYSEVLPGEACALAGSHGYLEIAVNQGSAAEQYDIRVGDAVRLVLRQAE